MTQTLTSTPVVAASSSAPTITRYNARRIPRWLWLGATLVLVGAAASWATVGWTTSAVRLSEIDRFTVEPKSFSVVLTEKGELKAAQATEIICEVEGRSTIISLIPEGTEVKKGDLLVELASDEIENRIQKDELSEANAITAYEAAQTELEILRDKNKSDIRKAKLRIELSQLALEKYEKGEWVERAGDAEIAIKQARINLERRTEDFEAAKKLWDRGFITKPEFNEDEFNFKRAGWDLEKMERAKGILEKYTHVADLRQRQSDMEEAEKEYGRVVKSAQAEEIKGTRAVEGKKRELELTQTQLAKLRLQSKACHIMAPTQGFVVYYSGGGRHFMSSDNQIREGATVYERQVLLSLPDTSEMLVVVRVHEAKTDKLELGQRVRVRVEGVPGSEFSGTVTKIAVVADTQNRWLNPDLKEYETEISLDPTDIPLKPGVTAHAEIFVETIQNSLAVPVQAVYSKRGGNYVFRSHRNDIIPVRVELGAIGTEWAEIKQGLSGGERILLAYSDEHKRLIPDEDIPDQDRGHQIRRPESSGPPGQAKQQKRGPQGNQSAQTQAGSRDKRRSGKERPNETGKSASRRTHP